LKRLAADYERVKFAFPPGSPVSLKAVFGNPPEKYHVRYDVKGLAVRGGKIALQAEHLVEVYLPAAYPRMAPQCRMLSPVFHPNIAPHAICIGDHWAAGESLVDLLVRIAEMISFQSYNVKSPLNGEAARWAEMHTKELPTDPRDFGARDVGPATHTRLCANCGATEGVEPCAHGHPACPACRAGCPSCGKATCVRCVARTCAQCGRRGCAGCTAACANCAAAVCADHRTVCAACGAEHCEDCVAPCGVCHGQVCLKDFDAAAGACRACSARAPAGRS
jgi:hypothetical protein